MKRAFWHDDFLKAGLDRGKIKAEQQGNYFIKIEADLSLVTNANSHSHKPSPCWLPTVGWLQS